jgi:DNA-binding response OmpR family regulator
MALTNKTKERIMPRILFAEDNGNLREVVSDYLSDNGFEVVSVSDGDKAWDKFLDERFDLVLLDVMMPGMSGFDLLRKIRSREDIPVILATAKVQEKDQLLGYSLGADEYVTKPFSLPVLAAKCKAVLERAGGRAMTGKTFSDGGFSVDFVTHRATLDGKDIKLASLDFDLLSYFISNRGRVLPREQILDRIWGFDYDGNDRVVDTHIKRLRKALGEYGSHIETVVKEGYRFV